jgi:hypothetical protein
MTDGTVVAVFAFMGNVAAATASIVVAFISKKESKKQPDPGTEAEAQAQQMHRKLNWWRVGIIILALSTLPALFYLFWLPGSENRWFVEVHIILVGIAAIGGVGTLVLALPRFEKKQSSIEAETWKAAIAIFFSFILLFPLSVLISQFFNWQNLSSSTKLMSAGFDLMSSEKYHKAMAPAEECSSSFHWAATRLENALGSKQLPIGKVSAQERDAIFANGVLNDVGACYWIKGRSAQLLQRKDEARSAYGEVLKYPHARVWDARGWFWSPAQDAEDRLKDLQ